GALGHLESYVTTDRECVSVALRPPRRAAPIKIPPRLKPPQRLGLLACLKPCPSEKDPYLPKAGRCGALTAVAPLFARSFAPFGRACLFTRFTARLKS